MTACYGGTCQSGKESEHFHEQLTFEQKPEEVSQAWCTRGVSLPKKGHMKKPWDAKEQTTFVALTEASVVQTELGEEYVEEVLLKLFKIVVVVVF